MSSRFNSRYHRQKVNNKFSHASPWVQHHQRRDNLHQFPSVPNLLNYHMVTIPQQIVFDPRRNLVSIVQSFYLPIFPKNIPPNCTVVLGEDSRHCSMSDIYHRSGPTHRHSVSPSVLHGSMNDITPISIPSYTRYWCPRTIQTKFVRRKNVRSLPTFPIPFWQEGRKEGCLKIIYNTVQEF